MLNICEWADKIGVRSDAIKSGPYKDIGSMFRPMVPEERTILQALVDATFSRFIDVIAEGRKGKLTKDEIRKFADGSIFTAEFAKSVNLIDMVSVFHSLLFREFVFAGVNKKYLGVNAYIYHEAPPLLKGLLSTYRSSMNDLTGTISLKPELLYLWAQGIPLLHVKSSLPYN